LQISEFPDPVFCSTVISKFSSAAHDTFCSAEEARVLYSDNYAFLDVRSDAELESEGKVLPKMPNVYHAPIVNFAKRYDSGRGCKVVDKTANSGFVTRVEKQVQNKQQGLILVCSGVASQGELRSTQALEKLKDAGYTQLVALKGGYAVRVDMCC
jgi:hypothetical protein